MQLNQLTSKIIGAAIQVHQELGPGLLESAYQRCMLIELHNLNLKVQSEVLLPIVYRGQSITEDGYRLDLLVEDSIIIELKSVEEVKLVHKKQLFTYLKLAKKPLGLLINFNVPYLKDGIARIVADKNLKIPDFSSKKSGNLQSSVSLCETSTSYDSN
jgi:GxxExxY protein